MVKSKTKPKYERVVLNLSYVVRAGDAEMTQHAKECLYEDIMHLVKYNELFDVIDIEDAPGAKESDIHEFLLADEGSLVDRFPQ